MSLKPFRTAIIGAAVTLELVILANMSYLYGSAFRDGSRGSSIKVLYVDYDQGPIGESVTTTYEAMKGPSLPTLIQHTQQVYPHNKTSNKLSAVVATETQSTLPRTHLSNYQPLFPPAKPHNNTTTPN